ncbi:hypothetical protein XAR_3889 [Xanthomonas citri pv. glycines str. 8ra]|nr:hypothetical protein XAR_3889 [Xanthomonas citri pv. glycines str. 8ra]
MSVPGWKRTTRAGLGRCACCTQTPGSGQLAVTIRPDQRRTTFPMRPSAATALRAGSTMQHVRRQTNTGASVASHSPVATQVALSLAQDRQRALAARALLHRSAA